jgi:hypothetical protein
LAKAAAQKGYSLANKATLGKDFSHAYLKFLFSKYLSNIIENTYILLEMESFLSSEKNFKYAQTTS